MASIYNTHKPAGGEGGLYLRIADGETVRLRLASDPAIFENVPKETDEEQRISTRYGWIVYNQDLKIAQIFQQGARFFKAIAALAQDDEWGDPTTYDIKVSRKGSSFNDTTYEVVPSPNRDILDADAQSKVKAIDLIEKIEASPFAQRVMWLSEFDKMSREGAQQSKARADEVAAAAPAPKPPVKKDDVVTDIDDEPINLDDIPF